MKDIIIIAGPTASGKTSLSIGLAKELNGEIISADSMQIYKGMTIGTAKIRPEEMDGVVHHLVDELEPDDRYTAADFKEKAEALIEDISSRGKIPMIVGGTGLYINSLIYELNMKEANTDLDLRKRLEKEAEVIGAEKFYEKLKAVDPKACEKIHFNNVKRVIRALEVYETTGKRFSDQYDFRKKNDKYNPIYFCLTMDRAKLYDRINMRIDMMLDEGLIEEVKALLEKGYNRELASMQGLGYKEIISYLDGKIALEEAIYILKRDTRRFAKRQLTWFRREDMVHWVDKDKFENEEMILKHCLEYYEKKRRER
jgi:tRNA dimethylallyltransferase